MANNVADVRERRSADIERRVKDALIKLANRGCRVSFYSVAKEAFVSRSALYRNDRLRQMVEAAREGSMQGGQHSDVERLEARVAALEAEVSRLHKVDDCGETAAAGLSGPVTYWVVDLSKVA